MNCQGIRAEDSEVKRLLLLREVLNTFRWQESIGIVWKQPISLNADELINQAIVTEENGGVLFDYCMIC